MQPFAPRPAGTVNIAVSAASQRVTAPSGTRVGLTAYAKFYFSAAGSATIKMRRLGVFKVQ